MSGLAAYAHFFAVFVLLAHAVSLLFLGRENVPLKTVLVSGAAMALLVAPLGLFVLVRNEGQLSWIAQPSIKQPAGMLVGPVGGRVPALAYGVACAGACLIILRSAQGLRPSPQTWHSVFLLIGIRVPLTIAFVVSQHQPIFAQRFFMICLPPLVILAGFGVSRIGQRLLLAPALFVLVLFSLYGSPRDTSTSRRTTGAAPPATW